jgi:hypothetical protein
MAKLDSNCLYSGRAISIMGIDDDIQESKKPPQML